MLGKDLELTTSKVSVTLVAIFTGFTSSHFFLHRPSTSASNESGFS